jgi:hypothetical protein
MLHEMENDRSENERADGEPTALESAIQGIIGYLNFSEGKPEPRFAQQVDQVFAWLQAMAPAEGGVWSALYGLLLVKLDEYQKQGGTFRDVEQAAAVLNIIFAKLLPAYREHHRDLLAHLSEDELYQPFFLARAAEAVLAQGPPWNQTDRIVKGALQQLNDFLGYRPIAILEGRPRPEPYEHERSAPIPLYIRGAGQASGPYHDLLARTLDILQAAPGELLEDASFDFDLLDEVALDARFYDQTHPVNRRPNYIFGEWDPHRVDDDGRFRRFILRQPVLAALMERTRSAPAGTLDEMLVEAAGVLGGTILMAAGIEGSGPAAYDSSASLASVMPKVARVREAYYQWLLQTIGGSHGARLRQEAADGRQPFASARRHLNEQLARQRAFAVQQRQLALLLAEIGYEEASRAEAAKIPAVSVRMLSDIWSQISSANRHTASGDLARAAGLLGEIEEKIKRGIDCGALGDPWNILGLQCLFPVSAAREDAIRDTRLDELARLLEALFDLYVLVISDAAASGQKELAKQLLPALEALAAWWDRFATVEVQDIRRVSGGEAVDSARHLRRALGRWQERGQTLADIAFWRKNLEGFRSPKAFALVIEALLRRRDYVASMGLFMAWLGHVEQVPLEEGRYSFHTLTLRWLMELGHDSEMKSEAAWSLIRKFFDQLEANAEEYWEVPNWGDAEEDEGEGADDVYGAAYEDMTYRDQAPGDGNGELEEGAKTESELALEAEALADRLRFQSTVARLWQIAVLIVAHRSGGSVIDVEPIRGWYETAGKHRQALLALLDVLQAQPLPAASGSYESMVEYDRLRALKEQLLHVVIATCLDLHMARGALRAMMKDAAPAGAPEAETAWGPAAMELEQALQTGNRRRVRRLLPSFLKPFEREPLLFAALADGGVPRQMLRARTAQAILRALVVNLPRLGLLRETHDLLRLARAMERQHPVGGRGVSEFGSLFQAGYQAVAEAIVKSAADWPGQDNRAAQLAQILEKVTARFVPLWVEHSQTIQLSTIEMIRGEGDWEKLRAFIKTYGPDLFGAQFMTLGNLRAILHRGVGAYLDHLASESDPLHPVRLVDDLDKHIRRPEAETILEVIIRTIIEHYEEYKDYNASTSQSDYGENLHVLFDFLRLKVGYERHAWQLRPLILAHEALARHAPVEAALAWQDAFGRFSADLAQRHIEELDQLEARHDVRLRTVRNRLEERFVKPLAADRLAALIGPLAAEAKGAGPRESLPVFLKLLEQYTVEPEGVGLDVPAWLQQLHQELHRVRARESPVGTLADAHMAIPQQSLSLSDIEAQLESWQSSPEAPGET